MKSDDDGIIGDDLSEDLSRRLFLGDENLGSSTNKQKEWSLEDFEVGRGLGKGKFGQVYLARTKLQHKKVALKVLQRDEIMASGLWPQLRREIEIHHRLHHPNVVKLFSYFYDSKRIYLVLEYMPGGELFTALQKSEGGRFTEARAAHVIRQLAAALHRCHKCCIVHRDIKPENILLGKNGEIKLADFGWSVQQRPEEKRQTLCGTLDYLPPEMVSNSNYDEKVDIWMLGVLMYELLSGTCPFAADAPLQTHTNMENGTFKMPPGITNAARSLLSQLLVKDPAKRLCPVKLVLYHPWITTNTEDNLVANPSGHARERHSH